MQLEIDEQTAFLPPKRPEPPAATVADLSTRWADTAQQALAGRGIEVIGLSETQQRLVRSDGTRLEVVVEHGFVPTPDAGRIAWSLFTRVTSEAAPVGARPLIVHCAGNAGDRYNSALGYSGKALPWGDVLVFDYPGYGDSTGSPSAAALEAASGALLADIDARIGDRDLVFWGHSLGGFICARLAERAEGADALILETTARNAAEVAAAWKPWWAGAFVRITVADSLAGYDSAAAAKAFGGPVLVLGGRKDTTLPVKLARSLAAAADALGADVRYVEFAEAGHRTVPDAPDFTATIDAFLLPLLND
jgi:pimeloyl-ACP methyl ester carboxylesterase